MTDENESPRRRNPQDTPPAVREQRRSHLTSIYGGLGTALVGLVIAITTRLQADDVAEEADDRVDRTYSVMRQRGDRQLRLLVEQAEEIADLKHQVAEIAKRCLTPEEQKAIVAPTPRPNIPPDLLQPLPPTPEAAAANLPTKE